MLHYLSTTSDKIEVWMCSPGEGRYGKGGEERGGGGSLRCSPYLHQCMRSSIENTVRGVN